MLIPAPFQVVVRWSEASKKRYETCTHKKIKNKKLGRDDFLKATDDFAREILMHHKNGKHQCFHVCGLVLKCYMGLRQGLRQAARLDTRSGVPRLILLLPSIFHHPCVSNARPTCLSHSASHNYSEQS